MKKSLRVIALILLVAGLASAGLAVRSYYQARAQSELFPGLQRQSIELEEQSDAVKGTPEEERLLGESRKYDQEAARALDSARSSRRWALILVISSALLILASIVTMMMHLKRRDAGSSS